MADVGGLLDLCERIATQQAEGAALSEVSGTLREVADDDAMWDSIDERLAAELPTDSELLVDRALALRHAVTRPLGPDRLSPLPSIGVADRGGTADIVKLRKALGSFLDTVDSPGPVPLGNLTPEAEVWVDGLIDIFVVAAAATIYEVAPGTVIGTLVDGLLETTKAWQRLLRSWDDEGLADGMRALAVMFSEEASSESSPVRVTALASVATWFLEEAERQDHHIRERLTIALNQAMVHARAPRITLPGSPAPKTPPPPKQSAPLPPGPAEFAAAKTTLEVQLTALNGEMAQADGPRRAELANATSDALHALAHTVAL